jgi:alkanesulfonate monooxygenase SsuD/methylene tetrahydromethanopterin reductase-like flavin-dependent oxidoreductase (luciferase family)
MRYARSSKPLADLAYRRSLHGLLKGEQASVDGKWLRMSQASIAVTSSLPPLWIAAEGPRILALAARADGWNHAYWGGDDTTRFKLALSGLHRELDRIGRGHDAVETSASIACVPGGWHEVEGGFREPEVAIGPPERITEVIRDYAQAGAARDPFAFTGSVWRDRP